MGSHRRYDVGAVWLVVVALIALLLAPAVAVSSDAAPSRPPAVTGLCSTDSDYLWTISTDLAGLTRYDVDYSTDFTSWTQPATLTSATAGEPRS